MLFEDKILDPKDKNEVEEVGVETPKVDDAPKEAAEAPAKEESSVTIAAEEIASGKVKVVKKEEVENKEENE